MITRKEERKMMTIKEASRLAGVSIRTLQYYDKIGLLHPTGYTESGYRLYDDTALETLQQILLFRELEFPLKEIKEIMQNFMQLFAEFGEMKGHSPEEQEVQEQVKKLQEYISEHFYQCSNQILSSLGEMYAANGEFTANIDKAGGEGTARFAAEAIKVYCGR